MSLDSYSIFKIWVTSFLFHLLKPSYVIMFLEIFQSYPRSRQLLKLGRSILSRDLVAEGVSPPLVEGEQVCSAADDGELCRVSQGLRVVQQRPAQPLALQ